jgi:DNA segregation ATPase FtsK/SpoIIIE, S-DNA-T family
MPIRKIRRRTKTRTAMPRASRRKKSLNNFFFNTKKTEFKIEIERHIAREIWAICFITLAVLTFMSLGGEIGKFGEWWSASFRGLFGIGINFVPAILLIVGIVMLTSTKIIFNFTRIFGICLFVAAGLGIIHVEAPIESMFIEAAQYGGFIGFVVSFFLRHAFAEIGAKIILFAIILISLLLTFRIAFRDLLGFIFQKKIIKTSELKINDPTKKIEESLEKALEKPVKREEQVKNQSISEDKFKINRPESVKVTKNFQPQKSRVADVDWVPPSLDLLDEAVKTSKTNEKSLRESAEVIRKKLEKFNIAVKMVDVNIGPTVMQFTLKPAEGVKLSKVKNLKDDLALALAAKSVRIEAPIPGKSLVGIEVPNDKRVPVRLKELLISDVFIKIKSNLRMTLGRDVSGVPIIADLAGMPHLLVAGQTGSGKSVGINSFLLSLIFQNSPNDLRMILIDPKRVELVPYNGIPHLLTPVINDPEKTINALKWAVSEMNRRLVQLSKVRVRNIAEFNLKVSPEEKMPFLVIVIDELADLMMVAGKEVEGAICRLAQMARAVGIHLIIATQRPSVDVITGLIKANIPTRISFRVAQGVDSKTILDAVGAEDLLGQGDMLFIPPGQSEPVRIQGAFVTTDEVKKVTNAIKLDLGSEEPEYDEDIIDAKKVANVQLPGVKISGGGGSGSSGDSDEDVLLAAARVVVETGRASASLLQRRLSLGYARAARIIDLLEERGFVGQAAGAKPRDIFISAEKLAELESSAGKEPLPEDLASRVLDEMEKERKF